MNVSTEARPDPRGATLSIRALNKRYSSGVVANEDINLDVEPGEVFGLLGPNGAGKTTLVKQIIGLLCPTGGSIRLEGHDLVRHPAVARELCAYLPQGDLPIDSFRLREVVDLVGRIRGGNRTAVKQRARGLIEALELTEWNDRMGVKLSGGVRRLLGFVMTAIWPVPLVILDEPTNDIDPLRRRLLWKQIRQLGHEGVAVLLVTHNVLEAEQSVDRLAIIDRARIVAQGTPSSLKADDSDRLRLRLNRVPGTADLQFPGFVLDQARLRQRLLLQIRERDAADAIDWARGLMEAGVIEEYALGATTLEDVYIRLIGRDDALAPGGA